MSPSVQGSTEDGTVSPAHSPMEESRKYVLSQDAPLNHPSEDLLDVAPYAQTLASGIPNMFQSQGYIIAINGPWGSGKSTLLNFIKYYIAAGCEKSEPIKVIEFNPWWFSGHEDLARQFFDQLGFGLSRKGFAIFGIARLLGKYAAIFTNTPGPIDATFNFIQSKFDPNFTPIPALKAKINRSLIENGKVLMIIDDIDRLTDAEIRELFRVIKAIGDFSNVVYLLAFDHEIVSKALSGDHIGYGNDFLEKIVQSFYEIPSLSRRDIEVLLQSELEKILISEHRVQLTSDRGVGILGSIAYVIGSPRKLYRYLNALRISYAAMGKEVNALDLIGIEALRLYYPALYYHIERNIDHFVDFYIINFHEKIFDHHQSLDRILANFSDGTRNALKDLVGFLFPLVREALSEFTSVDNDRDFLRDLRICSRLKFPAYFRLSIPNDRLSRRDFIEKSEYCTDTEHTCEILLMYCREKTKWGYSRVDEFLDHFDAFIDTIPSTRYHQIIEAIFTVGDEILVAIHKLAEYGGWFPEPDPLHQVIISILERTDKQDRFQVIQSMTCYGKSLHLIARFVGELSYANGRFKENPTESDYSSLFSKEEFEELEKSFVSRVRQEADNDSLLSTPNLFWVILIVSKSPQGIDCRLCDWAKRMVVTDENLIRLITAFNYPQFDDRFIDPMNKRNYRMYCDTLGRLINLDEYADRVRALASRSNLTDRETDAIKKYLVFIENPNGLLDDSSASSGISGFSQLDSVANNISPE